MIRPASWFWKIAWTLAFACCSAVYTPYGNSVRLSSLESLTFMKGADTAYRRSSGVPQLLCVKGCEFEPVIVRCKNVRSSGRDVTWRCEADLPSHLTFDDIEVNCEGYSSKEDDNVLEGSCGLKYSLSSHGVKARWSFLHVLILTAVSMGCIYFVWNPRALWQLLERS